MNETVTRESPSACDCGGSCGSKSARWIWIVLVVAVIGVLIARNADRSSAAAVAAAAETPAAAEGSITPATQPAALPRLVDLGAGKCIPCKMMTPILEDLKTSYAGKMDVVFIDVWEDPDAGQKYGVNVIPTQIFYDAAGTERFRHEGFFAKEDILAKWKELGVDLAPAQ